MIIVANERERRTLDERIEVFPVADFLAALWADRLLD